MMPPADRHGARRDVQQPQQEGAGEEHDHRGHHGGDHHAPADGALLLGREALGLLQEWHQRDLGADPDQQQQEQREGGVEGDDGKIHGSPSRCARDAVEPASTSYRQAEGFGTLGHGSSDPGDA